MSRTIYVVQTQIAFITGANVMLPKHATDTEAQMKAVLAEESAMLETIGQGRVLLPGRLNPMNGLHVQGEERNVPWLLQYLGIAQVGLAAHKMEMRGLVALPTSRIIQ